MFRPLLNIAIAFIAISLIQSVIVPHIDNEIRDSILSSFQDKPKKELFKVYHFLYEKKYDLNTEEGIKRYRIFKRNLKFIESENAKNLGYTLGITDFTDLTAEEFRQTKLTTINLKEYSQQFLPTEHAQEHFTINYQDEDEDEIPRNENPPTNKVDWTSRMGPLRSQGNCGSCWAFSTVNAIEGNYNINFGQSPQFSPQQLVDCDEKNNACRGGLIGPALEYSKTKGLAFENEYPYVSGNTSIADKCRDSQMPLKKVLTGFKQCREGACQKPQLMNMLQKGPLIVVVDAEGNKAFQHYKGGVLDTPCKKPNHAVVLVGVDRDDEGEFLRVMNSWGTWWGENGFFRIRRRDFQHSCFIESQGFLPLVRRVR